MTTWDAASKRQNVNPNLDRLDILVLGILIGLFAGAVAASLHFHFSTIGLADWLDSVLQNTGTEMLGAFLTFYLIEVMLRKRREQDAENRAVQQEKERLILQMGSPDSGFAVEAARILAARRWGLWKDTTLQEAYLEGANLPGVNLRGANLQGAHLQGAHLQGADLLRANLKEVYLQGAKLQEANLESANLQVADLEATNLVGAILERANLEGVRLSWAILPRAHLLEANLQGADLAIVTFDEQTTLPDGSKWTPDTDMGRFTNPEHPEFWRSDDPTSPAYRGKESDD